MASAFIASVCAESSAASDSALADMLLMGGAREVLVSPGSTFGYVAQGLAGRRATIYGGTHTSRELVGHDTRHCSAIATSEPNFHFLKHALKKHAKSNRFTRISYNCMQKHKYLQSVLQPSLRNSNIYKEIAIFFPQPWLMGSLNCGCEQKGIWG